MVKNILKYGLVAIIASVLTTAEARPHKGKGKGKPNHEKVEKEKVVSKRLVNHFVFH